MKIQIVFEFEGVKMWHSGVEEGATNRKICYKSHRWWFLK